MRLPGICSTCRRTVIWTGTRWRDLHRDSIGHKCHPVCGVVMAITKEPCARQPGHTTEHRSRYAMDNALEMKTGRAA